MSSLERAIEIAVQAHKGQTHRNGLPYIVHPLRVMLAMDTVEEMMVAVLHDVIEDSSITMDDLRAEGFSESVLEVVALLTHQEGTDYFDYVKAMAPHAMARKVKLADLADNAGAVPLPEATRDDRDRLAKYRLAKLILLEEEQ